MNCIEPKYGSAYLKKKWNCGKKRPFVKREERYGKDGSLPEIMGREGETKAQLRKGIYYCSLYIWERSSLPILLIFLSLFKEKNASVRKLSGIPLKKTQKPIRKTATARLIFGLDGKKKQVPRVSRRDIFQL
ncbi:MAG: hypothetical protein GF383_01790 [Candidatus Lokiarchaeota archaeon]|nr:hypothetical protein [Candidatus Lokiarchaeota archaeon]MBD3338042.1 hypothetical protein [Candidatus Lokiarchaeota archaeon]